MLTGPCIMWLHLLTGNLDRSLVKVAPPLVSREGGGPGCDILELLGTQTQSRNQLSVTPSRWGEKHRHPIDTRLPVDSGVFNDGLSVSAHF